MGKPGLYLPWVLIVCWVAIIGIIGKTLLLYAGTAGAEGKAPIVWPSGSVLTCATGLPHFIIFIHPHCPCSRATVANLDRLVALFAGRAEVDALLVAPPGVDAAWVHGAMETNLRAIPGLRVRVDQDGREARLFGAQTSGQSYVYDVGGHRVFTGGISPARGHEGDNPGMHAVVCLIRGEKADVPEWPVLGCPLFDDASPGESGGPGGEVTE